ncbi:MAG TPA: glutamate--tRNA ligase, partial [Woeseiaceae bacterium]|nr:glutamate--tRNA ligase [Woeseiaceae bacterium]
AETLVQMAESCRYCYEDFDEIDGAAAKKHLRPVVLEPLENLLERLRSLDAWTEERITQALESCAAAFGLKLGKIGQPLRVAVTGGPVSPPLDVTLALVGRSRSLARLERAIGLIRSRSDASS